MKARPLSEPSLAHESVGTARPPAHLPRVLAIGPTHGIVEHGNFPELCVESVDWASFTPAAVTDRSVDLIVPIVEAFDEAAAALFQLLSRQPPTAPVLAVLPAPELDSDQFRRAVAVVDDFVLMPVRFGEWRQRVLRLTDRCGGTAAVADALAGEIALLQLIGSAPAFVQVVDKIRLVARGGTPALISGETGTGKELCARAIHFLSPRRNQPFIPVDCGALPDTLFENEMFGHVRGAFTDAHRDQRGLIGLAEGGTLFLDEVDSLSPAAQTKLLRFLQERSFRPLGADQFRRANVNVLAAMNREPETLVRDKLFRADLFYRLNVVRLRLAPLRERLSDVPLLAHHFVATFAAESGLGPKRLSPSVLPKLLSYDWPGNVRELSNVLQGAVVLAPGRQILPEHVLLPGSPQMPDGAPGSEDAVTFQECRSHVIAEFEQAYVTRLLQKHGGNVTHAAREAGKDRRAFGRLVKKHGARCGSGSV